MPRQGRGSSDDRLDTGDAARVENLTAGIGLMGTQGATPPFFLQLAQDAGVLGLAQPLPFGLADQQAGGLARIRADQIELDGFSPMAAGARELTAAPILKHGGRMGVDEQSFWRTDRSATGCGAGNKR